MIILLIFLWFSLLLGQLGAIPLGGGVVLYLQDIALSLIVVLAIFRRTLLTKFATFRLVRPIALFTLLGIVSLLANLSYQPSWIIGKGSLYLVRWIVYALVYGVVLVSPLSVKFWLRWLVSFGVALGAIGLVQFVWYPDLRNLWYLGWDPHYYRVFATLLDPNYVGLLLVLTLFLIVYFVREKYKKNRYILITSGALVAAALLLTYSRSSYLALLTGVGIAVLLLKQWKVGIFFVLLFLLAVVYLPKPGGDTLSLDRYDSTVSRIQNWKQTIVRIGERPVFGFGFNVVPFLGKEEAGIDSSLLFAGVTTGVVGLVSYLWLLYEQVRVGWRLKDVRLKILVLSSLGAVLAHSFFVNSLFYPWVMIWIWVMTGTAEKEIRSTKYEIRNKFK